MRLPRAGLPSSPQGEGEERPHPGQDFQILWVRYIGQALKGGHRREDAGVEGQMPPLLLRGWPQNTLLPRMSGAAGHKPQETIRAFRAFI